MAVPPPQNFLYAVAILALIAQSVLSRLTRFATADSWNFVAVSDKDISSRAPDKFLWSSTLVNGTLTRDTTTGNFTISWGAPVVLHANAAVENRSMELSALETFQGDLLAFCDRSGLVFEIDTKEEFASPKTILRDVGKSIKPFKSEWATVKDKYLYVGSMGKEWVENSKIVHSNLMWVKKINSYWKVEDINWEGTYNLIRQNASASYPGYIIHEAVAYDSSNKQWLFLPRKISKDIGYDEEKDELMGSNILFILNEELTKVVGSVTIGPLEKDWGFTEIKLLPKPMQKVGKPSLIMGIKVKELKGVTESKVAVFDTEGKFYTDFIPLGGDSKDTHSLKFEGLAFPEKILGSFL